MTKRLHYLQHVPFETPGLIIDWAKSAGFEISKTALYSGDGFPPLGEIDLLVVMGGPMGVHDDEAYPWLKEEKNFLSQALKERIPTLGICLGAQLLAAILGAGVRRNSYKEIGWFPVELTKAGRDHPLCQDIPDRFLAFHWHGDTFDIPAGGVHLARSEACENQAFLYEDYVLGLQFHLEVGPENVAALVEHCEHEITEAPFIQSKEAILGEPDLYEQMRPVLYELLGNFLELIELD
ncbi:type 1 glutamine amidotransferase [Thermosulfuriphilus sp.]